MDVMYTDAPAEYDGFGTRTQAIVGTHHGHEVRCVLVEVDNLEWQAGRYMSGLYLAHSQRDFDLLRSTGIIAPITGAEPQGAPDASL